MYTLNIIKMLFNNHNPLPIIAPDMIDEDGEWAVVLFCDITCENYEGPRLTMISSDMEKILNEIGNRQALDHFCRIAEMNRD